MRGEPPVRVTCWSKAMVRKGVVADLDKIDFTPRWNAASDCTFTVAADHPRLADLSADGARVVVEYFPDWDVADPYANPLEPIVRSGRIDEIDGEGIGAADQRTFTMIDDWQMVFLNLQGWPNPAGTMAQQGDDGAYFARQGPAETVLKHVVAPNATRQGIGLTVPATAGLGGNIAVALRMHPLGDKLFPAVSLAGLGVRVVQRDTAAITLECWTPAVHTRVLDDGSGVIVEGGKWAVKAPTVTRVVVGAGGEGEARVFRQYVDSARETQVGPSGRAEVFVDARDVAATDPDLTTILAARGQEALDAGRGTASLSIQLAETDHWKLGKTFNLGDQVSVQIGSSGVLTDRVREAHIVWDESDLLVDPVIGEWSDSFDDVIIDAVAASAKSARDQQRSR